MDGSGCELLVNTWIRDALFALILISVVWAIRSSLPSDLWKRSQPLTLRATVDVVVKDRWVLPHTVDDLPLAKPPLVNWLSAPVVEIFGFTAWSHRVVPAFASLLTCVLTMRLARMFGAGDAVAFSAALLFAGTWLGFKSMLLVRPDPLLILASTSGLCAIVARLQGARWASLALSVSIAVGFLAKGIAILPLVLLAFALPRLLRIPRTQWPSSPWWVLFAAAFPFLVWIVATETVMPGYPLSVLIGEEILGRVSGTGAEASGRSSWQILLGLWKLPVHFTLRTLPLSIFGILAWRSLPRHDWAALLVWFVLLNFLVFGFSASRRADWMMPAVPALAAFAATRWCVNWKYPLATSLGICGVGFLLMSVNEIKNTMPWADQIELFAVSARKAIHAEPAPVLVIGNDRNHLVGLLGLSDIDRQGPTSLESLEQWLDSSVEPGSGFWIVAGDRETFGTRPPQLPVEGLRTWDQLDGSVQWGIQVEKGPSQYMWPGTLRLGWARRRQ